MRTRAAVGELALDLTFDEIGAQIDERRLAELAGERLSKQAAQ